MALEIKGRACEGCDAFSYVDNTGDYSPENTTGYGPENGVTGPADFDTYTLEVWYPDTDLADAPDYTYNLLQSVPAPDADGHYTWTITKQMLGEDVIKSGVYVMKATGVLGPATYIADTEAIFTNDIEGKLDAKLVTYDPTCPCKKGCQNPLELFMMLQTVKCGGICNGETSQLTIDTLYDKVTLCC